MKQVTIKDIAQAAGVSYSTVSRSLSGSPEISEKTRNRILQLCRDMNYTANAVARSMVMKSTKLLGLIVTDISNPFMSELAYYIDGQARARGYNIVLCNSLRSLEQECSALETRIRILTDMQRDYEGYSKAVRSVMREREHQTLRGIHGPVSGLLRTDR